MLEDRPDASLRVFWLGGRRFPDLEFLRFFPKLRRFYFDLHYLSDLSGIRHLPASLKALVLGDTRPRRLSLRALERLEQLEDLCIEGHKRDIAAVGSLSQLRRLALRSITLPDLAFFHPLRHLHTFELRLGGTTNLEALPRIGQLRYLEIWLVRGLSDLAALAELPHLQYLFLQALKHVTTLPSLAKLRLLRRVHLETLHDLRDLQSVADAPALEELLVLDAPHLDVDAFRCFSTHPALRRVALGIGAGKNSIVRQFLDLPDVGRFDFQFR